MPTVAASGASELPDTVQAAQGAVHIAQGGLKGAQPSFGLLFASSKHSLDQAMKAAQSAVGSAPLLGCTTAGEFTERGLTRGGLAVMLISAPEVVADPVTAEGLKKGAAGAADALCAPYSGVRGKALSRGLPYGTTITLIDGLCGSGEGLIQSMVEGTQATQQVVGGAAGDDGAFKATWVGDGRRSLTDGAVALHAFSKSPWGIGVGHGLKAATAKMTVTRASGNVVQEINGRPAFETYREHARTRGVKLEPKTAGEYMIGNEIGVLIGNEVHRARAPLSVGADGSLTMAASVAQGASVCILDGERGMMIDAARAAACESRENLEGAKPAAALVFDCICRGMILKTDFQQEIDAIREALGGVPVAGFLTYGEIANYKNRLDGWHNTTAVVLTLPA